MKKSTRAALPLLMLLFASTWCWAQANINEGLETASLWVDGTNGSDSNPGTQQQPLKTINEAVSLAAANNHASIGTQINIQPGTYREVIDIGYSSKDTTYPVTIQAVTNGTVILSGGAVQTGWTSYGPNPSIYTSNWKYSYSLCLQISGCPTQQDIALHRELIAVNGTVMTQVLSLAAMQPGSFYVDAKAKLVYVWPPSGTNMNTATVEIANQPFMFRDIGKSYYVIRGIVFQYANSCPIAAAVTVYGSATNILFDSDVFQWNNGQGLSLSTPTTYFTVQNSVANHNGTSGFQEAQTQYGLWSNDIANFNNWRGSQSGYYSCNVSGAHYWLAHEDTITGMTLAYNQTYGAHWDTDAYNVTASNMIVTGNLGSGLFFEKDEGPATVSASHICNHTSPLASGGLALRNSEKISFTNGTLVNNYPTQILVGGIPGGTSITNWETGLVYNLITQGLTNQNNTIEGTSFGQTLFQDSYLNGTDWTTFLSNLVSDNNTWWNAANTTSPFVVPEPTAGTTLDLAGWQGATGQDSNSTFQAPSQDPAAECNAILPDFPDYWLSVDNDSVTTDASGNAVYNLTATSLNLTGTLTLTTDGVSAVPGLTSTLSPNSITTSGTSVFTVTAATTTKVGTYPVTVIANSGNLTHTVTMSLVVPSTSIRLSTVNLSWGSQQINTTGSSQTVTVTNFANSSVTITSIASSGTSWTQTNTCGSTLKAGNSCTITVTFAPLAVGNLTGTITITDSDATGTQTVNLIGTGTAAPTVQLSQSNLAFGNQTVGNTSASKSVTLTNTGTVDLNITSIALSGTNPGDFAETTDCASPLAAGAMCTFTVTFAPTTVATLSASIVITDNTYVGSQTITLTGTGVAAVPTAKVTPASLSFGKQQINTTSPSQTVTLTNTGSVSLSITSITIGGSNKGSFAQTDTCGSTLAAAATCTITVTFTPTSTGSKSANITVDDNTSSGSQSATLAGSGVNVKPTVTLSASSVSFNNQLINTTSTTQTVTLTNTSTVSLTISSIAITGSNKGAFSQTNTCGSTLAAGLACNINLTFTPTSSGSKTATAKITDNTSNGSQTISLSGTGSAVSLSPTSLAFGSQQVNTTSASQVVTVTNQGASALNITSIATNTNWTETNSCGASVAKGKSCSVTVTFAPTVVGSLTGTLTLTDSDPSGSQTVSLTGIGTAVPTVTLSASSVAFGNQLINTTSPTQTVTLTNTSSVSLSITSITLGGANKGVFSQTNTCGSTVAAGATCNINLTFTPASTGSKSATVTISDNASSGTQTISLSGTGTAVLLSPTNLTFASQEINTQSLPQSVTISNLGATSLSITSITISTNWTQTNTCGASLAAGASCTATVIFAPTTAGSLSGSLTLTDNDTTGTQTVSLTGTGSAAPTVDMSPSSLSFGNQLINTTSPAQIVTLTNTGSASLSITSIAMGGTDQSSFSQTNTCGSTVAAGAACTISLTFTPASSGSKSATLTATDNASGGTQTVSLSGTGTAPIASFSSTSVSFANQKKNTTSPPQTITLTNTGSATLNLTSITLVGANATDFAETTTCGATLAAGVACDFTITFTPSATGTRQAALTVRDDSSTGAKQNISLTGTGVK